MLVTYKYRLYPNKNQRIYFAKCFGCVRFIYNRMLSDKINYYNKEKRMLYNTPAQYKEEFPWLKEVDSFALCNAQLNLERAFNNFFKYPEFGYPNYKSKKNYCDSYTTNNGRGRSIYILNNYIKLPKIGMVKIKKHRDLIGQIKSVNVSKTRSERYYAAILVEREEFDKLKENENKIGVDLGLIDYAVLSNGERIKNNKYLYNSEKRLRKLQKDLARCKNGSKNREKCRIKVAKMYEKIANQRKDFLNKSSKKIIDENQVICIENLNIKSLVKDSYLAKSIEDASWGEFARKLIYKGQWYGREVIEIDKYFPSSQICNVCGHRDDKKELKIRKWICPFCNAVLDRDMNAAINILNEGLRIRTVGITGLA